MGTHDEAPQTQEDRDLLPVRQMEYYDRYRSHDRRDRVLRFFERVGQALGGGGPR